MHERWACFARVFTPLPGQKVNVTTDPGITNKTYNVQVYNPPRMISAEFEHVKMNKMCKNTVFRSMKNG